MSASNSTVKHIPNQQKKSHYSYHNDIIYIATTGLLFFYYLSLITHNPIDPSYYTATFPLPTQIKNYAGIIGAELSAFILIWIGKVGYLLPGGFILAFFTNLSGGFIAIKPSIKKILKIVLEVFITTSILCFFANLISASTNFGGWWGYYTEDYLTSIFGVIGSVAIAFSVISIYTISKIKTSCLHRLLSICYQNLFKQFYTEKDDQILNYNYHKDQITRKNKLPNYSSKAISTIHIIKKHLLSYINKIANKLRSIFSQLTDNKKNYDNQDNQSLTPQKLITFNNASDNPKIPITPKNQPIFTKPLKPDDNDHKDYSSTTKNFDITSKKHSIKNLQTSFSNSPKTYPFQEYLRFFKHQKKIIKNGFQDDKEAICERALLQKTLDDFGIKGQMLDWFSGPRVTTFEFLPDSGVKQTKLMSIIDDISRALKVDSVLIQPLQGKSALGIQVPKKNPITIYLADILSHRQGNSFITNYTLPISLGMCPRGIPLTVDLVSMPHLMIAGATGSGKSVGIHSLINSVICARSPQEVRMILVDPKMLELSAYQKMPHLAAPVITDPKQACLALQWALKEMDHRYQVMQDLQVRNISGFNAKVASMSDLEKQEWEDIYPNLEIIPYLVIVIDELADLMLTASKEVEAAIQRLSQKSRACGIHLVLATQRPSVDVITGVIKANFPARIAFQVVSKHDSRTILDQIGAERLLGKGDMLFQSPGTIKPQRLQGAFVSEQEIESLLVRLKNDHPLSYFSSLLENLSEDNKTGIDKELCNDPMWQQAIELAEQKGSISASYLQRRLMIGYNRAARIIEAMEHNNLVAPANGPKPRTWLKSSH